MSERFRAQLLSEKLTTYLMRVCPPSLRVGYGCTSGLGRLKRILPLRSHEVCGRCGEARLARTLGQQRDTQPVVHHPHQRVETGGLGRLNLPPVGDRPMGGVIGMVRILGQPASSSEDSTHGLSDIG